MSREMQAATCARRRRKGSREKQPSHRLFFALWPDEPTVRRLADIQALLPLQGRLIVPENLHVTLIFVGNANPDQAECLRQAAGAVQGPSFTLEFDRLGYFRRPRIPWLGPSEVPAELNELRHNLVKALAPCGIAIEETGFRPHLSLARNAGPLHATECEPVVWHVKDFVLVESHLTQEGARYEVVQKVSLSSDGLAGNS